MCSVLRKTSGEEAAFTLVKGVAARAPHAVWARRELAFMQLKQGDIQCVPPHPQCHRSCARLLLQLLLRSALWSS